MKYFVEVYLFVCLFIYFLRLLVNHANNYSTNTLKLMKQNGKQTFLNSGFIWLFLYLVKYTSGFNNVNLYTDYLDASQHTKCLQALCCVVLFTQTTQSQFLFYGNGGLINILNILRMYGLKRFLNLEEPLKINISTWVMVPFQYWGWKILTVMSHLISPLEQDSD